MSDSPQHLLTTVLLYWWPNSEAQKTQDHRLTLYGNGSLLKPNSVNAVRLENVHTEGEIKNASVILEEENPEQALENI